MLRRATAHDLGAIQHAFRAYPDIFPFIRQDFLTREIQAGRVIYDFGMVAILKQMQRGGRLGTYRYSKGVWQMPELVKTDRATAWSSLQLFRAILDECVQDNILFGSVRNDNLVSLQWHRQMGYRDVGTITWKNGTLPGSIWEYDNRSTHPSLL